MSSIAIKPDDVAKMMEAENKKALWMLDDACRAAALRMVTFLANLVDDLGITYLGTYKLSLHVELVEGLWTVLADAPHAGIVELGARPHPVSEEGRLAIKTWAERKLGLTEDQAEEASWAICKKIENEGVDGHFLMRDSQPQAKQFLREELARILSAEAGKPA